MIPRIFRQARLSRGADEPLLDLEVHEKEEKEVEKEELTEEQKNEIRRAMNPFEFFLSLVSLHFRSLTFPIHR